MTKHLASLDSMLEKMLKIDIYSQLEETSCNDKQPQEYQWHADDRTDYSQTNDYTKN